jgi:hypothetical protein
MTGRNRNVGYLTQPPLNAQSAAQPAAAAVNAFPVEMQQANAAAAAVTQASIANAPQFNAVFTMMHASLDPANPDVLLPSQQQVMNASANDFATATCSAAFAAARAARNAFIAAGAHNMAFQGTPSFHSVADAHVAEPSAADFMRPASSDAARARPSIETEELARSLGFSSAKAHWDATSHPPEAFRAFNLPMAASGMIVPDGPFSEQQAVLETQQLRTALFNASDDKQRAERASTLEAFLARCAASEERHGSLLRRRQELKQERMQKAIVEQEPQQLEQQEPQEPHEENQQQEQWQQEQWPQDQRQHERWQLEEWQQEQWQQEEWQQEQWPQQHLHAEADRPPLQGPAVDVQFADDDDADARDAAAVAASAASGTAAANGELVDNRTRGCRCKHGCTPQCGCVKLRKACTREGYRRCQYCCDGCANKFNDTGMRSDLKRRREDDGSSGSGSGGGSGLGGDGDDEDDEPNTGPEVAARAGVSVSRSYNSYSSKRQRTDSGADEYETLFSNWDSNAARGSSAACGSGAARGNDAARSSSAARDNGAARGSGAARDNGEASRSGAAASSRPDSESADDDEEEEEKYEDEAFVVMEVAVAEQHEALNVALDAEEVEAAVEAASKMRSAAVQQAPVSESAPMEVDQENTMAPQAAAPSPPSFFVPASAAEQEQNRSSPVFNGPNPSPAPSSHAIHIPRSRRALLFSNAPPRQRLPDMGQFEFSPQQPQAAAAAAPNWQVPLSRQLHAEPAHAAASAHAPPTTPQVSNA